MLNLEYHQIGVTLGCWRSECSSRVVCERVEHGFTVQTSGFELKGEDWLNNLQEESAALKDGYAAYIKIHDLMFEVQPLRQNVWNHEFKRNKNNPYILNFLLCEMLYSKF